MRHHAFATAIGIVTAAVLAPSSQSLAASADPTGYWMKPDAERESKIQVFKCGTGKKLLCAKIAWLKDPHDSKGQPLHDIRNENPSLRGRQIVGLTIFNGMTPSAPSTWTGKIYNPEDGHTYSATLTVQSRKQILLRGCKAWLLCGEKQWLRTGAPPADVIPAAPAEGTEQIEASAEPASPPDRPDAKPAVAAAASSAGPQPQALAGPQDLPVAPTRPWRRRPVWSPQEVAAPCCAARRYQCAARLWLPQSLDRSRDGRTPLGRERVQHVRHDQADCRPLVAPDSSDQGLTTAAVQSRARSGPEAAGQSQSRLLPRRPQAGPEDGNCAKASGCAGAARRPSCGG